MTDRPIDGRRRRRSLVVSARRRTRTDLRHLIRRPWMIDRRLESPARRPRVAGGRGLLDGGPDRGRALVVGAAVDSTSGEGERLTAGDATSTDAAAEARRVEDDEMSAGSHDELAGDEPASAASTTTPPATTARAARRVVRPPTANTRDHMHS